MSSFTYKSDDRVVTIGNDKFIVDMSNISFTNQKVSKLKSNSNYPRLKYPGYFEIEPTVAYWNSSNGTEVTIDKVNISDPLNIFSIVGSIKDVRIYDVKIKVTTNNCSKVYQLGEYFVSDKFPINKSTSLGVLSGMRTYPVNIGFVKDAKIDLYFTLSYISNNTKIIYTTVIQNSRLHVSCYLLSN